MRAHTTDRTSSVVATTFLTVAAAFIGSTGTAEAIVPVVQYVQGVSALDSESPKMAHAECPPGTWVLGGAAYLTGESGEVAIQAAFPMFDAGLFKYIFVVKASEDVDGTAGIWRVTAGAYCTSTTAPVMEQQSSPYDSASIKSVTAPCPADMRVVGMGAEVSRTFDTVTRLVETTPPLDVVFQGFEVNADLTAVTARAVEEGAAIDDSWGSNWRITAVAACAFPLYFDGLERKTSKESSLNDPETRVEVGCPVGKRVIATGSKNKEPDMGQWYLDRFSRYNAFKQEVVAEAYRNNGLTSTTQYVYAICADN